MNKGLLHKTSTRTSLLVIALLFFVRQAAAETNVSVTTNTGGNTINGTTVTSSGRTIININGKEYVNDDSGSSQDIVDNSNGGRVEVHVNNAKQSNTTTRDEVNDAAPTIDVQPTIAQKKAEIKQLIAQKKTESEQKQQSAWDRVGQSFHAIFAKISSIFNVFASN